MHLETLAVHADHEADPTTGAVMPPLYFSTTFERSPDGSYPRGYGYIREENPTRKALEDMLCALEGGAAAVSFPSGMAAIMTVLQALSPGDHVLFPLDVYYGARVLLGELFTRWGLTASFVDMTDLSQVRRELRPHTKLVWTETPSNPLLHLTDIAAVASLAHDAGIPVVCDNTWATPALQQPFTLGADLVMHSMTKYLGGHSDVLGGAIIAKEITPLFKRVQAIQKEGGIVPAPFDCWLVLRGIRTLAYRMRGHSENALAVASFLSEQPQIEVVHYPGLPTHPQHALAARQMSRFGGMISIQVHGGRAAAMALAAQVRLFTRATSLGGPESLIEHRASIEGPGTRTPENLLRLSIGLEHPDDLISDLAQALSTLR